MSSPATDFRSPAGGPRTPHPAALSLPRWPTAPEPVDTSGGSWLIIVFNSLAAGPQPAHVAEAWAQQARALGPTEVVAVTSWDTGASAVHAALRQARTGVRIMVCGNQYDVLLTLASARECGASPAELRSFVTSTADLPVYCAHCRGTFRVTAVPGDIRSCVGCARSLEIHPHLSAARGSFLASDAHARELIS